MAWLEWSARAGARASTPSPRSRTAAAPSPNTRTAPPSPGPRAWHRRGRATRWGGGVEAWARSAATAPPGPLPPPPPLDPPVGRVAQRPPIIRVRQPPPRHVDDAAEAPAVEKVARRGGRLLVPGHAREQQLRVPRHVVPVAHVVVPPLRFVLPRVGEPAGRFARVARVARRERDPGRRPRQVVAVGGGAVDEAEVGDGIGELALARLWGSGWAPAAARRRAPRPAPPLPPPPLALANLYSFLACTMQVRAKLGSSASNTFAAPASAAAAWAAKSLPGCVALST